MTIVVNVKLHQYDVYVGRSSDSTKGKWGNPFSFHKETIARFRAVSREDSLIKYERYLRSNLRLMQDLAQLKGKRLGCFCVKTPVGFQAPIICHAQILAKYADMI